MREMAMRGLFIPVLGLLFAASSSVAQAPQASPESLATKFGTLESVWQASLSSDGTKLAYLGPLGEDHAIYVADLVGGGQPKAIIRANADSGQFQWCSWATSARLVCQVRILVNDAGVLTTFSRMIAIDADGKRFVRLSQTSNSRSLNILQNGGSVLDWDIAGKPGHVLMTQQYVPEREIGTHLASSDEGLGVDLVDSVTLKRSRVEPAKRTAVEYISDGHGTIRIMGLQTETTTGYSGDRLNYFYRKLGSRSWEKLSVVGLTEERAGGFNPYAVDSARNVAYGFDEVGGMATLFSVALDGSGKRELLLGRKDVDVDELVTIGRDRRVIGAGYATERRTIEYFDPELKALSAALTKALPGNPHVEFVDATEGEKKLLVLAWSDTNPGMFYLYDKGTRQLEELLPVRAELQGQQLARMQAVSYPAADGTMIPAYLTLPPGASGKGLPAIVMPHGGPSSRDEWGFDWLVQFYAARGYAVLQPNFRGSSGYGSSWYRQNGFKSWRIAVGDVNDAGRWLVSQGIAAPNRLGVVGWSYGGYAALQSAVLDPDLFKAIVAIAPVTDLESLRLEFEPYSNYLLVDAFIGRGPHVKEGSPAQNAVRFKAPVLLFHGTMDQNVAVGESRLMEDRLRGAGKAVTYVEFPGLTHPLSSSKARQRMLGESDAFLRRAFGM
jgi:dipeptidyl aminopeptidase/acylaminoacyl peptidase